MKRNNIVSILLPLVFISTEKCHDLYEYIFAVLNCKLRHCCFFSCHSSLIVTNEGLVWWTDAIKCCHDIVFLSHWSDSAVFLHYWVILISHWNQKRYTHLYTQSNNFIHSLSTALSIWHFIVQIRSPYHITRVCLFHPAHFYSSR